MSISWAINAMARTTTWNKLRIHELRRTWSYEVPLTVAMAPMLPAAAALVEQQAPSVSAATIAGVNPASGLTRPPRPLASFQDRRKRAARRIPAPIPTPTPIATSAIEIVEAQGSTRIPPAW